MLALELGEQEQFSHCFEGCLVGAIYGEVPGSSQCQAVGVSDVLNECVFLTWT